MTFVRIILLKAGVDRAVAWAVLGRIWTAAAGVLSVLFIARFLSGTQQGFYFTFASIVALQLFFELGLSYVLLQFVSHECVLLQWTRGGTLNGDHVAKCRLSSLVRWAAKWYLVAALLMVVIVIPAGWWFFSSQGAGNEGAEWQLPWVALGLVTAGVLLLSPALGVVEGTGKVAEVALLRLTQGIALSCTLWVSLAAGMSLYAPSLSALASLLVGLCFILARYRRLFVDLFAHRVGGGVVSWRHEVWPFQWRIALSVLSGYFIFYLFTPVLFAYRGPVEAGQMGMSLGITTAISSLALAWMNTKMAPFGALVAKHEWTSLDSIFFRTMKQSFAVCFVGCSIAWAILLEVNIANLRISERLLPPASFGLLLVATLVNNIVFSEAVYLRSHKKEPFLWLSILNGVLTGLSTWLLGRSFGPIGMLAGYLFISAVVGLGGGTIVFLSKRAEWHDVQ